jgi:hypothetical protein
VSNKRRLNELIQRDRIYRDVEAPVHPGAIWAGKAENGEPAPEKNRYGPYKLTGPEARRFLNGPESTPWKRELANLEPATEEFNRKWQEVGRKAGQSFDHAQAKFAEKTRFEPQADRIRDAIGIDVRDRSVAAQNVVFAGAMQYGAESDRMSNAIEQKAQRLGKTFERLSDEDIMTGILEDRAEFEPAFSPFFNKEKEYGSHLLRVESEMREELVANPQADLSGFGIDTPVYVSETWQKEAEGEVDLNLVQGELQGTAQVDPVKMVVDELKKSEKQSLEKPAQEETSKGVEDMNPLGWGIGGKV